MLIHTAKEDQDQTKLWCDLREETSLVSTAGEYVGGQSGFAHLTGGYSAGYCAFHSLALVVDVADAIHRRVPLLAELLGRYVCHRLQGEPDGQSEGSTMWVSRFLRLEKGTNDLDARRPREDSSARRQQVRTRFLSERLRRRLIRNRRDEMESLVDFLGREPSNEAFMESLMGPREEETATARL